MTSRLWIALGFVAALVLFLMITFLKRDTSSPNQHNTLRFLSSLCAGFAGGFFTGDGRPIQLPPQFSAGRSQDVPARLVKKARAALNAAR